MSTKSKFLVLLLVLIFLSRSTFFAGFSAEDQSVIGVPLDPLITLTGSLTSENTVDLTWTRIDNKMPSIQYEINRDDTLIGITQNLAYSDVDLNSVTSYTYMIKSRDSEGKIIAESNKLI